MVQRKSLTNKCLRKCINCLGKIAELLIWNTATTRKIENEKHLIVNLGHCLNIALFVQVQSFTYLQPSYLFSKSVWWNGPEFPLLPTHLDHRNAVTPVQYFSIDEFCQAFQRHFWVISDLCDILAYIFAFLLKLPLMSELLLVVSGSSG